jgi:YVTN family beta-propeller protein
MRSRGAAGLLLVLVAMSYGASVPRPQTADESGHNRGPVLPAGSIVLPDSLGGVANPERIALNPTNGRVYVCGGGVGVAVIDAATGRRVSTITVADAWEMQYNQIANVLYLWIAHGESESYELATVDCMTDSVVAQESLTLWPICVNLKDNKLYAAMGKEHMSAVAVLDGHTGRLRATVGSAQPSKGAIGGGPIVWNPTSDRVYYSDADSAIVAIDGRTDRQVDRIPHSAGLQPRCANPQNNKIYASSIRTTDSSFAVIDCRTNHIVAWLPIYAADASYNPIENKVYCSGGGGVVVIDGKRNTILKRVGFHFDTCLPAELCFDSLNDRMYCFGGLGGIAVIDCRSDSVVWTTGAVAAHQPVLFRPANRLYCVDWHQGDVYAMDGSTFKITDTITPGYRVKSMFYNWKQDELYCANDGGHALAVIDCGAGRVKSTIEVGSEPGALACSPDGKRLYCANKNDGTISVIDCESDQVVDSIRVGSEPRSLCLSPPNHRFFCGSNGVSGEKSAISVIDYRSDSIVAKLVGGPYPTLFYDSLHDRVFRLSYNDPWNKPAVHISTFEAKSLGRTFLAELQGSYLPDMCYDPVLDRLYVARMDSDEVTAIDCKTGIMMWVMRIAGQPTRLVYSPRQRRLYVASYEWTPSLSTRPNDISGLLPKRIAVGTVEVVNPNAGCSIVRIKVADEPEDLLYVPEADRIYCACASSDTVLAIDCETNKIVDRYPVGARPVALAYSPKHGIVYVANSEASTVTPISISNVPNHR